MRLLPGPAEGAVPVTVVSLEMTDPQELIDAPAPDGAGLREVTDPRPDLSESFYRSVGEPYFWVDRLDWSAEQWRAWVDRPGYRLLVCTRDSEPAGYAELDQHEGDVEIAYFGLLPGQEGRGLGSWWLARTLESAWALPGARRVWVHTCDLDHPAALATYRNRGMREFDRAVEWRMP